MNHDYNSNLKIFIFKDKLIDTNIRQWFKQDVIKISIACANITINRKIYKIKRLFSQSYEI
jgi:hypothetical protein